MLSLHKYGHYKSECTIISTNKKSNFVEQEFNEETLLMAYHVDQWSNSKTNCF